MTNPDGPRDERVEEQPDVAASVREHAASMAEAEVDVALARLDARGDLTDGQRRAVRELADGIVESLVAAPARTVEAARETDDEALRTVVELFDPDGTDRPE